MPYANALARTRRTLPTVAHMVISLRGMPISLIGAAIQWVLLRKNKPSHPHIMRARYADNDISFLFVSWCLFYQKNYLCDKVPRLIANESTRGQWLWVRLSGADRTREASKVTSYVQFIQFKATTECYCGVKFEIFGPAYASETGSIDSMQNVDFRQVRSEVTWNNNTSRTCIRCFNPHTRMKIPASVLLKRRSCSSPRQLF